MRRVARTMKRKRAKCMTGKDEARLKQQSHGERLERVLSRLSRARTTRCRRPRASGCPAPRYPPPSSSFSSSPPPAPNPYPRFWCSPPLCPRFPNLTKTKSAIEIQPAPTSPPRSLRGRSLPRTAAMRGRFAATSARTRWSASTAGRCSITAT